MTPEERAKAVVEHFAASLPPAVRPDLEKVISRAIKRALQQLAELEQIAASSAEYAMGRGKNGKGRDENAVRVTTVGRIVFAGCGTALTQHEAIASGTGSFTRCGPPTLFDCRLTQKSICFPESAEIHNLPLLSGAAGVTYSMTKGHS